MNNYRVKIVYAAIILIALVVIYFLLVNSSLGGFFSDMELLIFKARGLGFMGPLLFVGLMVLAIVFNPLPSAPIAIAAGAVYGHTMGTVYIVIGAEIGALAAFLIARLIGAELVRQLLPGSLSMGRFGTQNGLTLIVFVSRLIPFMSFDLVSYAAGLTVIKFWRFALATLLGLVPVSFALAHVGSEVIAGEQTGLAAIVLIMGVLMAIPLVVSILRQSAKNAQSDESGKP
jgi:uncharacterized membrane protein YdjX (TVP38/TMEM64 family)